MEFRVGVGEWRVRGQYAGVSVGAIFLNAESQRREVRRVF